MVWNLQKPKKQCLKKLSYVPLGQHLLDASEQLKLRRQVFLNLLNLFYILKFILWGQINL